MKKVLVACEYSQVVTKAFRDAGASAWSCDIVPDSGRGLQRQWLNNGCR